MSITLSSKTFGALALFVGLAACGETPVTPSSAPPAAVHAPEPDQTERPPRYVGLWAVDRRICDNPAWRFQERSIATQGEVYCEFETVREVVGGYDIDASCTAEAPPAPFQIQLQVTAPSAGMTVSGGPWDGPIDLVLCRSS